MLKPQNSIILFLILSSFYGCKLDKSGEIESNFTKSNTNNGVIESKSEKNLSDDKVLKKIGISAKDGKIIIEPNKTKKFLESLAKKLESEAKKIGNKVKDINISMMGIKREEDKIVIDINKTHKVLEKFSKELEKVAKELEKVFK